MNQNKILKFPTLFRRQSLVLPTLTGWLVILLILFLIFTLLFRNLASFLVVNQPVGADHLVIEAWMNKGELDQGLKYFETNGYQVIILVGGDIENDFHGLDVNYAERAADYLQTQNLSTDRIVVVRTPYSRRNRTFANAVAVRRWLQIQDPDVSRLDVFSSAVHTRRSWFLYRQAFDERVDIGIVASSPAGFDPTHWWNSSASGKGVVVEFANWLFTRCCFSPESSTPEPG